MNKKYNSYPKGSEWRKWDLHFHAPSQFTCAKYDQYPGDNLIDKQNKFISELKAIEDISVIGITDYFSLDGYKMVLSHKSELDKFDLIIPNIELRITPVTGVNRKINLHIIPNIEVLSIEEIERFLYKFEFGAQKFTCENADLIKLGKLNTCQISDEQAFKNGLNEYAISYDKFFEVFNALPIKTKDNILIGISNNSSDGASGIKDIQGIRDIIYSGVDFIFSGQSSDRDYFLGNSVDSKETIIKKYGELKPCFHGSDYHGSKDGKKICVPFKERFCWIKADPTFDGLKQVINEPEERVFIGENPPLFKKIANNRTKYIKELLINQVDGYDKGQGVWFEKVNISLNSELVAIIGNKGSGKSAIADIISLCSNYYDNNDFSFLSERKFKEKKNRISKNFEATLTWIAGIDNKKNLAEDADEDEVKIKYIPQGQFERLTNEISTVEQFQKEIESVVFSHIPETERLGTLSFDELIKKKTTIVNFELESLRGELKNINEAIIKLEEKSTPSYRSILENKLKTKNVELKALVEPEIVKNPNEDTDKKKENEAANKKIEILKLQIENLEQKIQNAESDKKKLIDDIQNLTTIKEEIKQKQNDYLYFIEEKKTQLIKYWICNKIMDIKLSYATFN